MSLTSMVISQWWSPMLPSSLAAVHWLQPFGLPFGEVHSPQGLRHLRLAWRYTRPGSNSQVALSPKSGLGQCKPATTS